MLPSLVSATTSEEQIKYRTPYQKTQVFNLNTRYPYFTKEMGDYFGKSIYVKISRIYSMELLDATSTLF